MILKIHKRKDHGKYEVVAKVGLDGNVEGDSHIADVVEYEIENDINKIEDGEVVSIDNGSELLNRLEKRYSTGYYLSSYEKDEEIDKQGDGDDSHVPANCERQYIVDVREAPEGARIYDGIQDQDADFYCSNYVEVGAFSQEFLDDAKEAKERINENIDDEYKLAENEVLWEQRAQDTDQGDDLILNMGDEEYGRATVEGAVGEISSGDKKIMVVDPDDDSKGRFISYNDWDDEVEGVVIEGEEGERGGQWELYEKPRDLYNHLNTESKTPIDEYLDEGTGGVNAMSTYVAEFDNGEKAVYKPSQGQAHGDVLETDIAWYEAAQTFFEDTSFVPETAAADLKRGFGSAMLWIDDAEELTDVKKDDDKDTEELIGSNLQELASISFMDYTIGNDDRHGSNIMVQDGDIYAIDNGGYGTPTSTPSNGDALGSLDALQEIEQGDRYDKEEVFRTIVEKQNEILKRMEKNPEDLINIGRMVYGQQEHLTRRLRRFIEQKEEDEDTLLRENFEDNLVRSIAYRLNIPRGKANEIKEEIL